MRASLTIDNRIRVLTASLPDVVLEELRAEFTHENPAHKKLLRMGYPTGEEPAFIRTWRTESNEETSFPRGGMARVREVLARHGVAYDAVDCRMSGNPEHIEVGNADFQHRLELRSFQPDAVAAMIRRENCLLQAPTGSGKTTIAFALIAALKLPTLVIVPSKALYKQWIERAQSEFGIPKRSVGVIQGRTRRIGFITIAMQKTLHAQGIDDVLVETFGVIIADEVQRFAARTFHPVIDPFPARYRFGVSADEKRKDKKEFLVYDVFGDVAYRIKREKLEDAGDIHDVQILVVPTDFRADWYRQVMAFGKPWQKNQAWDRLLGEMASDPARNELIYDTVAREAAQGTQTMVLSHRREHCFVIDAGLAARGVMSGVMVGGEEDELVFDQTKVGIREGKLRAVVGTIQSIGEGLDLPRLDRAVVTMPIAGNKQLTGQVRGRVCRTSEATGKEGARLWYLWDRHVYGMRHLENLTKWNRQVLVLESDGSWIEGREYLKRMRNERRARRG